MRVRSLVTMVLCGFLAAATALAQADFTPAPFTPPGVNLALHKSYTLDPSPNYGDCSLDEKRTLLTDGEYTRGYFWVQKTTVGWVHSRPVIITVDLGKLEPLAGVSYNTAAGVAGVNWPTFVKILVSDDGQSWTSAGDLIPLANKTGAPPAAPYRIHRFATGDLQTRGRYVCLIVDCPPYTVVDEVEVYRGQEAWLGQTPPGRVFKMTPKDYQHTRQVADSVQGRMSADLNDILTALKASRLSAAQQAAVRDRAARLQPEIEAWDAVGPDFTTILPLNDLHARVYALNAPVLRSQGYRGLALWGGHRYDPLQPLGAPAQPPAGPVALRVRMMRGEVRAEVLHLTNATDAPLTVTLQARGLGQLAAGLSLREVIFTDTRDRTPIASALGAKMSPEAGLKLTVPAGVTRQAWLQFDTRGRSAGEARGTLTVASAATRTPQTVPLSVRVANLEMPAEFSTAIGGWDESNNQGGYQITAANMRPLIENLRDHGVNMPWSNPQVMPKPGQYDAEGNMTTPPDFTAWDEWVKRWPGAKCWGLFPNVGKEFAGEPMGTPRFDKMVGAWATAWVEHAAQQGIKPAQIMLLLVDEPSRPEQDQTIITWARALKAAQPNLTIWNDPLHTEPEKVDPEFYALTDVLCPNAPRFLNLGQAYQDTIVARQQGGCELWFYSCSGPSKLLDPASYYRGQFWLNIQYGGKGSCYWAFADEAGFSWNAYIQPRACYSPLFLSPTTVTDAKPMESIREGAEDFEYFALLRARVEQLRSQGKSSPALTQAQALLAEGPPRVTAMMPGDKLFWATPKDRGLMDRLRLQALDLLEKLGR